MKPTFVAIIAATIAAGILTFTAVSLIIVTDVTLCAFQPSCTITLTHRTR